MTTTAVQKQSAKQMVKTPKKKRSKRTDREFLPSALSILESPPSPLAGVTIAVICLFFVVALCWAYVGKIDIIAVAQGKVQPVGRIKTVQSLAAGRVERVFFQNGDVVNKGDLLFRLDAKQALVERDAVIQELADYNAETVRRTSAIAYASGDLTAPIPPLEFGDNIPELVRQRKVMALAADVASLQANVAKLLSQRKETEAEYTKFTDTIEAEHKLIAFLQMQVDFQQDLLDRSLGYKQDLFDAQTDLAEQMTANAQDEGQLAQIEANLQVIDDNIDVARKTFIEENTEKYDEAKSQIMLDDQRLNRAEWELSQMEVRSPANGVIQSSTLTTSGQVVQAGDEVMHIVPDDVTLEVECYLANADIGFVKPGLDATIKVESFPFTRYGTIEATVVRVGKDAVPEPDATYAEQNPTARRQDRRSGEDRVQNLVYPVTLSLKRLDINVEGRNVPLRAGMAVTAEIKTGKRRMIDYLLSPLTRMQSEALRER